MTNLKIDTQDSQQATKEAFEHEYRDKKIALIGYGLTGQTCAQYLLKKGASVDIYDQYLQTDIVSHSAQQNQQTSISFFQLCPSIDLLTYDLIVVSPGVHLQKPYLQKFAEQKGVNNIIGDIELFARELNTRTNHGEAPIQVIAVTGSNGKSTVVDMLNQSLQAMGIKVGLGGNFGVGALSLLEQDLACIVLELSSFQLESTYSLSPDVACILNVSSDHLDRHINLENYAQAKQRIYHFAKHVLYNKNDELTAPSAQNDSQQTSSFSIAESSLESEWVYNQTGIYKTNQLILAPTDIPHLNEVQQLNMMVCLACIDLLGLNYRLAIPHLLTYKGLAHRFEQVFEKDNTCWINDSKATNPGAAIVAINSLCKKVDKVILIAGGDSKGADMTELSKIIRAKVAYLVLMGKDAQLFTQFGVPYLMANSMQEAVSVALQISKNTYETEEDISFGVLLSPACASIDMFKNYQDRGEQFVQSVREKVAA